MGWQRASGDNWRALVDADIGCLKRVIGNGLRSKSNRRRVTEIAIAIRVMNRMPELDRPHYVRTS